MQPKCLPCEEKYKALQRDKLIYDAKIWAKQEGIKDVAIIRAPNGREYYCAGNDERTQRLEVIGYYVP